MRQEIHLFIGGAEVEFSTPPQILYNYTETDLRKPTAVKNSFSKSITVDGTPQNNDIFKHIWRLDHYQRGGMFNPMVKTDFELYCNGELYEKGYCKLNNITHTGNNIQYDITLYGGLGGFLQELSYGNGDNNVKKTLADLKFGGQYANEPNLDITINKDTVNTAWRELNGDINDQDQYDVINFAVTSEGVPSDFGASKVLVNMNGNPDGFTKTDDGYKGVYNSQSNTNGYALAETPVDLTVDTSLDLRSYLLRPVVSVKSIFDAICDPKNNGGYQIDLDDRFFIYKNPYYSDAWVTLPMLRDLGVEKTNSSSTSATATKEDKNHYRIGNGGFNANNAKFAMQLTMTPQGSTSATELFQATYMATNASGNNNNDYVKNIQMSFGVIADLEAYDAEGNLVAESYPKLFCCGSHSVPNTLMRLYTHSYYFGYAEKIYGSFKKINNQWIFCDETGNPKTAVFEFSQNISFASLKLRLQFPYWEYYQLTRGWPFDRKKENTDEDLNSPFAFYTDSDERGISGNYTVAQIKARNRVYGTIGVSSVSLDLQTLDFESGFSNTEIPKSKLLATPYSPADFLLSYCKLFGLYIYKDPTEESDWPNEYPSGVIHIVDRSTFYTDEYVNIEELIDRSKPITINPTMADTKWYSFAYEDGDGEAENKYKNKTGYSYGRQLVNTGLAFNSDTTQLYDDSCFRNGVMVREKNVYFQTTQAGIPCYARDGLKYNLFKVNGTEYETKEEEYPRSKSYAGDLNMYGLRYYDVMPKLQIHSEENSPEDGSGILLFYNGFANTQCPYRITDDVSDMAVLNDGEPCWLLTTSEYDAGNNRIAITRYSLPFFTRDCYSDSQEGKIFHSWNFGHPAVTYVPNTFTSDYDCIYDKCWRDYMRDLYDENTKRVTAFVRLGGKPNPIWLRRWYWFDNAIWRINAIKDWNIGSYDSTEVEFIKVQDVNNYDVDEIGSLGRVWLVLDTNYIGKNGGTITGKVLSNNPNASWNVAEGDGTIYWTDAAGNRGYVEAAFNPAYGRGESTNITITVPANSGPERTYRIGLQDSDDHYEHYTFTQEGNTTPALSISPSTATVGSGIDGYTFTFSAANIQSGSYAVSSSQPFCSVMVNENNHTITATVSANSGASRSTTITLSALGIDGTTRVTATATLTQEGNELSVSPTELTFDYDSTTGQSLTITSNGDWTINIID